MFFCYSRLDFLHPGNTWMDIREEEVHSSNNSRGRRADAEECSPTAVKPLQLTTTTQKYLVYMFANPFCLLSLYLTLD